MNTKVCLGTITGMIKANRLRRLVHSQRHHATVKPLVSNFTSVPLEQPLSSAIFSDRAVTHDPQEYPDPNAFNPDRFVVSDARATAQLDPRTYVFGVGRR